MAPPLPTLPLTPKTAPPAQNADGDVCLPAGACYVCGRRMVRSSGGKWLCKACGFLLTCCDP